MNLWEIELFHLVCGVLVIIIMRLGENNVLGPKYIDIYIYIYISISPVRGEGYMVHLHFLFIIHKNGKSIRAWPILKSNYTSFRFFKQNS